MYSHFLTFSQKALKPFRAWIFSSDGKAGEDGCKANPASPYLWMSFDEFVTFFHHCLGLLHPLLRWHFAFLDLQQRYGSIHSSVQSSNVEWHNQIRSALWPNSQKNAVSMLNKLSILRNGKEWMSCTYQISNPTHVSELVPHGVHNYFFLVVRLCPLSL